MLFRSVWLSLLAIVLSYVTVTANVDQLYNQIIGQLDEIRPQMLDLKTQRNTIADTLERQPSGYRDRTLSRLIPTMIARMDSLIEEFNIIDTKITVSLDPRKGVVGKEDILEDILKILHRIEKSIQTVGDSDNVGISVNVMQTLLANSANQLEKNLEMKLRDLVDAQQKLMQDLFDGFSSNIGALRQTQTHYITGDGIPRLVQEALTRGLEAFTVTVDNSIDRKLHEFLSSVQAMCQPSNPPLTSSSGTAGQTRVETSSHGQRGSVGWSGSIHRGSEATVVETRHGPVRTTSGGRRYSSMGVDIVGQPDPRRSQNLRSLYKPTVDASYWAQKPKDCSEIYRIGYRQSGLYDAYVENDRKTVALFCDMDTSGGGWTVIQRRDINISPHENFDRPWGQYKKGFGELNAEFWLGLQRIHSLTMRDPSTLRIEITTLDNRPGYAEYENVRVLSEFNNYLLQIGRFSNGNIKDELSSHNDTYFSTPEEDNDRHPGRNCAETFFSGWWFDNCFRVNLNGLHVLPTDSLAIEGMYWGFKFPGNQRIKGSEMKVRPIWFSGVDG